ncbi:MAG: thioredoxin-dependent thiol peroxidase [Flavobacteriaceae bacterium]|jgi:peroxiredoxin Q/BCP|nr:thioredoxin-dependent thiol peroxidase [Flavobacteriaceae bacterium]MBT4313872.1 thioredoxin-dependent thiol peroxidase [Flavobacteriaceae bacterium]MBT5091354.1 thioredoxin-dependent thiol peroxidase [Flavobacteriaceae bacterium]MBT5446244.1 thioredoxin-dependent thiol peroxidase [Flavobacteriaceae bacterium]MBT5694788.1 thioredoxin-dependent thiol peroxidase [Flavobacteriaceae bacterium]
MKPLKVGEKVSSFTVNDHLGNPHSLEDYTGSKVVVFFYPKASTPGCTAEACDLRDHYKELKDAGYVLLGVSADTEKKQKAFVDKFDFPFPLLADTEKKIIEAFGVWGPKKFMGKEYEGIHRMTFILDESGVVERVIDKVKTKEHAAQILE